MPAIASELFFSSGREGEELIKRPVEEDALLADEPTLRGHSTTSSLPDVGSKGEPGTPGDEGSEIDPDLFVDLSKELAAIENSEALSAPHSENSNKQRKTPKDQQLSSSNCSPLSGEKNRTSSPEAPDPLSLADTPSTSHREALKQPGAPHVLRFAEEAGVHHLHAGSAFSLRNESAAFFAGEEAVGEEEGDSHTDSDLASLLGSIESARRRLQAQEVSEARLDAAIYAGGLSYLSRSAAATFSLLSRGNTHGPRAETSSHLAASKPNNSLQAGPDVPVQTALDSSKTVQEKTTYAAPLTAAGGGPLTSMQGRQRLGEGAPSTCVPSLPEERCNAGSASAALQLGGSEAALRTAVGLGGEGGPQALQDRVRGEQVDSTRADLAAEVQRSALLSAELAELKQEHAVLQKELAAARGAASLAGKVAEKIREWQAHRGSPRSTQHHEESSSDGEAAANCLEALEALIASTDADASLQASQVEVLQRELLDCREAQRQTELKAESLRNEIGFLHLVNKKLTQKREAEQAKALETLKQHVQEKAEETKNLLSEREALRRELDLLKTHFAEQLAAVEAAKAAVQHELNAAQHVFALKQQDLEETVNRLTRENTLLRQHKEAAEKRLLENAQTERLVEIERREMKEKQQRLAAQHEALKKSLQEIRSCAVEARKKWQEKEPQQQLTAAADLSLSKDSNHQQRESNNNSSSNSSSSFSSKGHNAAEETVTGNDKNRDSSEHDDNTSIPADVSKKLPRHDTTAAATAAAGGARVESLTKEHEAKVKKPAQLEVCYEGKEGRVSREREMHEEDQRLRSLSPVRLSPPRMQDEPAQQRGPAILTADELAVKSKLESAAAQTLRGNRDASFARGENRREPIPQPRAVRGQHHIDLGVPAQSHTLLNASGISRPPSIEEARLVSSPRRGERSFELKKGGACSRAEEERAGTGSEEEAFVEPITTVIASPLTGFSGSILLDSPPRPLVFISGKVEKGIDELPEPEATRCMYTAKLQEVEEANEMLRRTNMLVDRENAFLIKTLQGLKNSPSADGSIRSAAFRDQQRVIEAAPVPLINRSPNLAGGEGAGRTLLLTAGSAAASDNSSLREELPRPGGSPSKRVFTDGEVRMRACMHAKWIIVTSGSCAEASQDSAEVLSTQKPCALPSEDLLAEAAAAPVGTAPSSPVGEAPSAACKGDEKEELMHAPSVAACSSSAASPLPEEAEPRGAPKEWPAADEAPLASPPSHGQQAEAQGGSAFVSVDSNASREDTGPLPVVKDTEAEASASCAVNSVAGGTRESAAEETAPAVSGLQRGLNECENLERSEEDNPPLADSLGDEQKRVSAYSKSEMVSQPEPSPSQAVSKQRGAETPQLQAVDTPKFVEVPSRVEEKQQSRSFCMQAANEGQVATAHASRERPRCASTASDSSCWAAASTQLLVAEAGRSFKLKFLQHRNKATLSVRGEDWGPPSAASPHPLPRTPLSHAQHKTTSELCVLPPNLIAPLANGNSNGLTLPSRRRCEACLAAACDRILAEASITPESLMRKLASSPSRHLASSRSAGTTFEALDLLSTSGLSPTAAAAVKQLAAAALRGNTSGSDTARQGGLSGRTNGQVLLRPPQEGEREGGVAAVTSPSSMDRRRFSAADPRDLLRLISSEMCRASSSQERTQAAKEARKGERPRSSSAATRAQRRSSSLSAAEGPKSTLKEQKPQNIPASGVRAAPVRVGSSSAATRRRPAEGTQLKSIVPRASSSSGVARPQVEQPQPSATAAAAAIKESHSILISSSKTEQETFPLMRITRTRLLMQTKENEEESSRLKASTRLRKRFPMQRSNTKHMVPSSRPASPHAAHANKTRPTSTSRGRFPGERPPWDFSCAPLQEGPRVPFRSLLRK
ncbi:hypothetical protein Esti_003160 [Eimeria stiedai]